MRDTTEIRDKVVLVGLSSPVLKKEENASEETMEELSALVETAGGETVGIVLQNRPTPDPHRRGQGGGGAALLRKCGGHHGHL